LPSVFSPSLPVAGWFLADVLLVVQELSVRARERDGRAVADLDDFRREPFDEIPIV
jgi:hypothetical protein